MSMFEVLRRFGTFALLVFTGSVLLFLVLHLVRIPLVLIAKVLEISMRRLDAFVTRHASKPPTGPVNQFFHPTPVSREEAINVHA
ncbi:MULTISPECIES: hypothetical protein [Amycolatopsis]|uniref:Uncharacterized protein n=2 Tax=Amycolatopsis TaxID=1813 RepID=A0ABQ3JAJ4_9PSEU|nr:MULTISPECIES: hypothetical protein [Amycolatopsis]MDQ0378193.1 hypothetical protein [Amycolatopsis thermophila]GHF10489.1 hypothetical protein GCM10017786_50200 [Amycolatopsis deserti]